MTLDDCNDLSVSWAGNLSSALLRVVMRARRRDALPFGDGVLLTFIVIEPQDLPQYQ